MIYIVQLPFTLRGVATESELNEVLECCRTDERVEAAMESIFSGRRFRYANSIQCPCDFDPC